MNIINLILTIIIGFGWGFYCSYIMKYPIDFFFSGLIFGICTYLLGAFNRRI